MRRKKHGQILVEAGLINEDQLVQALEEQKKKKGKQLGRIIIEKEWAKNEDICKALSKQLNIPYVKLKELEEIEALYQALKCSPELEAGLQDLKRLNMLEEEFSR